MAPLCFVTGASGFVGRHLLPRLLARYRVRALVRPGQALPAGDGEVERLDGRLTDTAALARGCAGAEVVVHLAALVSFRPEDRAALFATNTDATAALAAAARTAGVARFLHVSTISAVACRDRPEAVDETAPYNFGPLRIGYCDSKFAAEQRVLAEVARGLDAVIVNPPSMYGAGDRRKGDASLLTSVLRGELRLAPPGGINVADVASIVDGMLLAIDRGRRGERYLLLGENLTGRQLLERIAGIVGGRAPRWTAPAPLLHAGAALLRQVERVRGSRPPLTSEILRLAPLYLWYSGDKAARELGFQPRPVDPGIAAAWRELQAQGG